MPSALSVPMPSESLEIHPLAQCQEGYSDGDNMDELPVKRPRTVLIPDPVMPFPTVTQKKTAAQRKKAELELVAAKAAERLAKEKVKMLKAAENAVRAVQILENMQEKERAKEEARVVNRAAKEKAKIEVKLKGKMGKEGVLEISSHMVIGITWYSYHMVLVTWTISSYHVSIASYHISSSQPIANS